MSKKLHHNPPSSPKGATEELERRAKIVSQAFSGIQPPCEAFYISCIHYSASRADAAFKRYSLSENGGSPGDELVAAVQEAITHAGGLSRYFWPPRPRRSGVPNWIRIVEDRGQKLREAFQLDNESALNNRKLRNTFEHFDENLDLFLLNTDAGRFFPHTVLSPISEPDDEINHYFRLLDVATQSIVLLGTRFDFQPIREEIEKVLAKAEAMMQSGYRLP